MNDRQTLIKRYEIFTQKVKELENTKELMDNMGMYDTGNLLHKVVENLKEEITELERKWD